MLRNEKGWGRGKGKEEFEVIAIVIKGWERELHLLIDLKIHSILLLFDYFFEYLT